MVLKSCGISFPRFRGNPVYAVYLEPICIPIDDWTSCAVTTGKIPNHDITSPWLNECKAACCHGILLFAETPPITIISQMGLQRSHITSSQCEFELSD